MNQPAVAALPPITVTPYRHEKTLFGILAAVSVLFWGLITVGTVGIVWIYMAFIYVFVLFARSALISFLKGNAVRIGAEQFPDLHQRLAVCCRRLGLETPPESYLMTGNGLLNAFATRFLRRYYVVLLSDVVDALDDDPEAINFYIGHELGHIDRKHIANGWWMGPALMLPILGAAYRRAQEYTCDQYGLSCCASQASASRALAVLAAGTRRWKTLDTRAYIGQCGETSGFWMSVNELASDYPWLCKRMAYLENPGYRLPSRHPLAWFLALFMPRVGPGGPLLSLMFLFAMIGMLAAIAIPAYQEYTLRAAAGPAFQYGSAVTEATARYYGEHQSLPDSIGQLGIPAPAGQAWEALLEQEGGRITINLASGKFIAYTPRLDERGQVVWTCATSLPAKAVPAGAACASTGGGGLEELLGMKTPPARR